MWMRVLTLLGAVMLAAGVVIGFMPSHSEDYNCGSAFLPSDPTSGQSATRVTGVRVREHNCEAIRSDRRSRSLTLLIGGALIAGVAGYWIKNPPDQHLRDDQGRLLT